MARKKIRSVGFRRIVPSLAILFFLLVAVGITTSLVQQEQDLRGLALELTGRCQKVPAGSYNVEVKTFTPASWEVICGKRRWSGELHATTILVGNRWIPMIYSGSVYTAEITLKDICLTDRIPKGWEDICKVCQYIDCSKFKISGTGMINKITCPTGGYRVWGEGSAMLSYEGRDLRCSAKGTYKGNLMGVLKSIPGPIPTLPPLTPTPTPICKTGVNSFSVYNPCPGGFRNAKYICYDGTSGILGDPTSCKSSDTWRKYAEEACKGHSSCPTPIPTFYK